MTAEQTNQGPPSAGPELLSAGVDILPLGTVWALPDAVAWAGPGEPRLNGTPLAWHRLRVVVRGGGATLWQARLDRPAVGALAAREPRLAAAVQRLEHRPAIRGWDLSRPLVMGIVNVTPDSFSDGGRHDAPDAALAHARKLMADGADLLDIGGESTRPGSPEIDARTQCARVLPVIAASAEDGVRCAVDTRSAVVMQAAVAAGAAMVNDVSALDHDPGAADLLAGMDVPVVLMHMRGDPRTMRDRTAYDDLIVDVVEELAARVDRAVAAGIARDRLLIDPGFGFAKTEAQNFALLKGMAALHALGLPILAGLSRKSFVGAASGVAVPDQRQAGSIAAAVAAVAAGAHIVRVHDVAETVQALKVWNRVAAGA